MSQFKLSVCTGIHIGDRVEQQDRVAILPCPNAMGCALFLVCDGMGGKTGGALAAQQVVTTAEQLINGFKPGRDNAAALLTQLASEAHTIIRLSAFSTEQEPHSTVVALLIQQGRADWLHIGDSRLYRYRGAELLQRTEDHSYVNQMVREGKIRAEEASSHRLSNVLTQALGSENTPTPTLGGTDDLRGGDTFMLCSDGVWHYFSDTELGRIVHELTPRQASEILVINARDRAEGRGDNLSLIVLKLEANPNSTAAPRDFSWLTN